MKKIILFFIMIILVIAIIVNRPIKPNNILYSWNMETLTDDNLIKTIKKFGIKTLYQDFNSNYLNGDDNEFIKKMNDINVDVYHLTGDPSWAYNSERLKKEIDKVLTYNQKNEFKIKGIVFDIEPYSKDKENFDFKEFVNTMKIAYEYAHNNDLYMINAIPVWFENYSSQLLEDLIHYGSDEVSLMNYSIKNTIPNIKNEIAFAKKYNKNINTIYEINLGNSDYFESYEAIDADFKKIKKEYNYDKLRKAYHYYEKMK